MPSDTIFNEINRKNSVPKQTLFDPLRNISSQLFPKLSDLIAIIFLVLVISPRPAHEKPIGLDKIRVEKSLDLDLLQVKNWKMKNYNLTSFD